MLGGGVFAAHLDVSLTYWQILDGVVLRRKAKDGNDKTHPFCPIGSLFSDAMKGLAQLQPSGFQLAIFIKGMEGFIPTNARLFIAAKRGG